MHFDAVDSQIIFHFKIETVLCDSGGGASLQQLLHS